MPVAVIPTPPAAAPAPAPAPVPAPAFPPAPAGLTASDIPRLVAEALAAAPAPAPALPVIPVAAEALDYLRPDAPHSFVPDRSRHATVTTPPPHASSSSAAWSKTARCAGNPYGNVEVGTRLAAAGTTATNPALVPPGYRPELYVNELEFPRPLVDAVTTAPISDATPFQVPRFVSAAGLTQDVAAEGVNPAAGTITSELVPVTPKAVSGIYDASRELVDSSAGGVAIDMIAMQAIRESWSQQTEARVAAALVVPGDSTLVALGGARPGRGE